MAEYRKLPRQPLVFALAEFRFSQILKIDQYIPEYQESLRKTYPLSDVLQEQSIQVNDNALNVSLNARWAFVSADKKSTVTLGQDRLVYFTTEYPRFNGFASSCMDVLRPFIDLVEPELLLRIGLRYGDLIKIAENETLEEYVDPYFGFPKVVQPLGQLAHQRDEVVINTDIGRLMIRSLYGHNNLVNSPDLQGIPGLPQPDSEASERIVLDFDHFWSGDEEVVPFELGRIEDILTKLHEKSRDAFWRITTKTARDTKWS